MALIDFYHIVEALRRMSSYMTGGELQYDLDEMDLLVQVQYRSTIIRLQQ